MEFTVLIFFCTTTPSFHLFSEKITVSSYRKPYVFVRRSRLAAPDGGQFMFHIYIIYIRHKVTMNFRALSMRSFLSYICNNKQQFRKISAHLAVRIFVLPEATNRVSFQKFPRTWRCAIFVLPEATNRVTKFPCT